MKVFKKNGFTLIELIVVMVIIDILAIILIPTIAGFIEKAKYSNDVSDARNMTTFLQTYELTEDIDLSEYQAPEIRTIINNHLNQKYSFIPRDEDWSFWYNQNQNKIEVIKIDQLLAKSYLVDGYLGSSLEELIPQRLLLSLGGDIIGNTINNIRNLNSIHDFNENVDQIVTKFPEIYHHLQQFNPDQTLYINAKESLTSSNHTVSHIIYSNDVKIIQNNINSNIKEIKSLFVPQFIQFIEYGTFANILIDDITLHNESIIIEPMSFSEDAKNHFNLNESSLPIKSLYSDSFELEQEEGVSLSFTENNITYYSYPLAIKNPNQINSQYLRLCPKLNGNILQYTYLELIDDKIVSKVIINSIGKLDINWITKTKTVESTSNYKDKVIKNRSDSEITITYILNGGSSLKIDGSDKYPTADIYKKNLKAKGNTGSNCTVGMAKKGNHVFVGWYCDEGLTIPLTGENSEIVNDTTLYAKWEKVGEVEITTGFSFQLPISINYGLGEYLGYMIVNNQKVLLEKNLNVYSYEEDDAFNLDSLQIEIVFKKHSSNKKFKIFEMLLHLY